MLTERAPVMIVNTKRPSVNVHKTKTNDTQAAEGTCSFSFFPFCLFLACAVLFCDVNHLNAVMEKVIGMSVECQKNELSLKMGHFGFQITSTCFLFDIDSTVCLLI